MSVLLLDVMGTLVHDPFFVEMPAHFGLGFAELLAQKHPRTWLEFELGTIDEATCLARFFADERAFDHDAFRASVREAYAFLPGIEALLRELAEAAVPMHALSNYSLWYRLIEERLALSRWVPWTFVSCHTGVRKPSKEAYLGAAAALGVAPGDCLFVDDRRENVAAAEAVGMRGHVFQNAAALRGALVDAGVLPAR
jgi:FMN hydrolase / 5-amino-6-(5-phospho-D-ribitylamino)uracil phosphatase